MINLSFGPSGVFLIKEAAEGAVNCWEFCVEIIRKITALPP
jgi:hypothetical protein